VTGAGAGPEVSRATDRLLRLLLRLYPEDFRDEVGAEWLSAYRNCAAEGVVGRRTRARYGLLDRRGVGTRCGTAWGSG
jgi:hypothetical protein